MKYKVGDIVKVRQWEDMVKEYGLTDWDSIHSEAGADSFVSDMQAFCGTYLAINLITTSGRYRCEGNEWSWEDWMFEDMPSPSEFVMDSKALLDNIESRISYRYLRWHNNEYVFPNSYEGDLIKVMHEYIQALRKEERK